MNFTLNGRILKYVNEECIMIKMENNWKELPSFYNDGYKRCNIGNKNVLLHRIIAYLFLGLNIEDKTQEIDHINCIRNDNRIENLRIVTHQQNMLNKTNTKGYHFRKDRNKWRAVIKINKKQIYLGLFDTEEEASQAYLDAKQKYHLIE